MREELKAQRAVAKALELLKSVGADTSAIPDTKEAHKEIARTAVNTGPSPSYQAEGVLMYLSAPARFDVKKCKRCEEPFMTNYRAVTYCSDICRAAALRKLGIIWNPHKNQEFRWGSDNYPVEPPIVIPPEAVAALVTLANRVQAAPVAEIQELQESRTQFPEPNQETVQDEDSTYHEQLYEFFGLHPDIETEQSEKMSDPPSPHAPIAQEKMFDLGLPSLDIF